jgi:hypothetical protein
MTTQSLLKEIKNDKYTKPTIQALASQIKLGLAKFDDDFQNTHRLSNLSIVTVSIIWAWQRIQPTFTCKFPEYFIESAIYGYCGEGINDTFEVLGIHANEDLASELKKWLSE